MEAKRYALSRLTWDVGRRIIDDVTMLKRMIKDNLSPLTAVSNRGRPGRKLLYMRLLAPNDIFSPDALNVV